MDAQQQKSLFDFDRDLTAFAKQLDVSVVTVVKKVGFDLFARIIKRTPVDTGRARASWTIAVNQPDRTVAPEGTHPEAIVSPEAAAASQAAGALTHLKPYEPVWISNNLPYIEALEKGHSDQAPAGMVALSIAETETEIDTILRTGA